MKRLSAAVLTLAVILCSLSLPACFTSKYKAINESDECTFYTPEELEPIFAAYHGDFTAAARIVIENEELGKLMVDSGEYEVSIMNDCRRYLFFEQDWDLIVKLFRETGLSMIERNAKYASGPEFVAFVFRTAEEPGLLEFFSMHPKLDGKTTILYYLLTEEGAEDLIANETAKCEIFYKLEDNWWIGYYSDAYIGHVDRPQ